MNFKPHTITTDPTTGAQAVHQHSNFVMLSNAGLRLYVQHGEVYNGGNDPLPQADLPTWFWDSFRKLTPSARKACGLELPEDEIKSVDQLPVALLELLKSVPEHLKAQLLGTEAPRMPQVETSPTGQYNHESSDSGHVVDDPGASRPTYKPSLTDLVSDGLKNEVSPPKDWVCDECGEATTLRRKGVHKAGHARAAKRAQKVS